MYNISRIIIMKLTQINIKAKGDKYEIEQHKTMKLLYKQYKQKMRLAN